MTEAFEKPNKFAAFEEVSGYEIVSYTHERGQFRFPEKYFKETAEFRLILIKKLEKFVLDIYPKQSFDYYNEVWCEKNNCTSDSEKFKNHLHRLHQAVRDKQDKVVIPSECRKYMLDGYKGELVVAGAGKHLRLWRKDDFDEIFGKSEFAFEVVDE